MKILEGKLDATGLRFGIVVSRFNQHITSPLLEGALQTLLKAGAEQQNITVAHVPGAFEIPLACKKLALAQKVDAILTLGCVLRGETRHYEEVCRSAADGIQRVALETGIPVTFGILMADSAALALARAGGKVGNRGDEVARAAIEMAHLLKYGNA